MKQKTPLTEARQRALTLVETLKPYCQRIEIAGSIRREKPEVGDIEIVAIPNFVMDMFSTVSSEHELNSVDWSEIGTPIKNGPKYKQIALTDGMNLDLFIVTPPAQWGVQFLIRTGPADFSHKVVTPRKQYGLLPSYLRVQDGAIWSHNHVIPTPEEQDVFDLLGMEYIEPKDRL